MRKSSWTILLPWCSSSFLLVTTEVCKKEVRRGAITISYKVLQWKEHDVYWDESKLVEAPSTELRQLYAFVAIFAYLLMMT
jgi:hypothetical protein